MNFKPNPEHIKEGFGDKLASKIIAKLLTVSQESINQHVSKGYLVLMIDGEEVILTKQNFIEV